jgi:hypothetical protein
VTISAETLGRALNADERAVLVRRARLLAWSGNAWHLVEFAIALGAGIAASSIALIGFGFDSLIEAFAGFVIVWRLARLAWIHSGPSGVPNSWWLSASSFSPHTLASNRSAHFSVRTTRTQAGLGSVLQRSLRQPCRCSQRRSVALDTSSDQVPLSARRNRT